MKMLTIPALTVTLVLLAGCASKPQPPAWQPAARSALDGFTDDWLRGDSAAAEAEFARARRETAATGRFELVAQAELVRCAARMRPARLRLRRLYCAGRRMRRRPSAPTRPISTAAGRAWTPACCPSSTAAWSPAARWPASPIRWRAWSRPAPC
jgi:hypothetical protein